MGSFSQRYNFKSSEIMLESVSNELICRIWGAFYKKEFDYYSTLSWENYTTGIENMMIEMGVLYKFPENRKIKEDNASALQWELQNSHHWYTIFDFIDRYLAISKPETREEMGKLFNRILEDEVSGYRVVNNQVIPIINNSEIQAIQSAVETPFQSVNNHIEKATSFYGDRQKPDYENSVKESISAVEAMCCTITGMEGRNATLGNAIKKLKDKGVVVHPFMEEAFTSLYKYASNSDGIRHGGIDYTNVPSEDAKYMLVSCSAFVNYLTEKWRKAQE